MSFNSNSALRKPPIDFQQQIPMYMRDDFRANGLELVFDKNTYVYRIGSSSMSVFFVLSGRFKIGAFCRKGERHTRRIVSEGDFFGELALFGSKERVEFVQSMDDDSSVLRVSVDTMRRILAEEPDLQKLFNQALVQEINTLKEKIDSLKYMDARTRVVDLIRDFALRKGQKVGFETVIRKHLSHQDIADMSGTSRQTVTTIMNDLKASNIINFNRRQILIRDLDQLS